MQSKHLIVLIIGLVLATAAQAAVEKSDPKSLPKGVDHLKNLEEVNKWNTISDDYSLGGDSFKPYTTQKEK